jgi:hypothetical protein
VTFEDLWDLVGARNGAGANYGRERQAALSYYFDKVSKTELVTQVPTRIQDDDFAVEVMPRAASSSSNIRRLSGNR